MKKLILIVLIICFLGVAQVQAKWWIFGQSEDIVELNYLYVNGISFDDIDDEVILSTESLESGMVRVHGKASAGRNKIGKVSVSIDGGQTWRTSEMAKDGAFEYRFDAETGRSYKMRVKAMDTTGKSNEPEDTAFELTVTDESMMEQVEKTLANLKNAYEDENDRRFMQFVSPDFEGGGATLDMALRKDFAALDNIRIDFTIVSAMFHDNRYHTAVQFNRNVFAVTDGMPYSDRGMTEFTFVRGKKGAMLYEMKNPLIFGLTYAADVATGTTQASENTGEFITVSEGGSVTTTGINDIGEDEETGGEMGTSGTFTFQYCDGSSTNDGFDFMNDTLTTSLSSDIFIEINIVFGNTGVEMQDLGVVSSLNNITVPETGYSNITPLLDGNIGGAFAVKLPDNTYAVCRVLSYQEIDPVCPETRSSLEYRYNPDGSRVFP